MGLRGAQESPVVCECCLTGAISLQNMPPSPSLRCSPGRERRTENTHKRGHSFESGLSLKAKVDDLALFNDMQNKEQDNSLLQMSDDFEDSISKLRYFSNFKLGVAIPVRGESSDLLKTEGDKNDYDWLLTPPDTPLFPSLDDDDRQPANQLLRGRRPRSQPIAISRSSMSERTHSTNRTSASPRRLSTSPRSSNSVGQMRGRPSSAPRSSPPPVSRPATPSRRPTTPNKPNTPPRSSTPTLRRMSTGSSGQASSYGKRGVSPVTTSRGNSASPKFRGWQANLDGFSSDAPPNLRTSLPDCPALHTRGLSPPPRNGRDSTLKCGRQSMSPTASRSVSSSHSQERDRLSTYSRGSVASSGDDDMDSLHSETVGISSSLTERKNEVIGNNRAMSFSKKPSKTVPASSAPKRSFSPALRQVDHRKTPQNMFRPLLSSVPATTFYAGKGNSLHRPMFSRNSSLTTSSNTSSEQGVSIALDLDGSENQNGLAGEWEKTQDADNQEEIFTFDKMDKTNEDDSHKIIARKPQNNDINFAANLTHEVGPQESENSMGTFGDAAHMVTALESSRAAGDHFRAGCYDMMALCAECGNIFRVTVANIDPNICQECSEKDVLFTLGRPGIPLPRTQDQSVQSDLAIKDGVSNGVQISIDTPELSEKSGGISMPNYYETMNMQEHDCLPDCCPLMVINQVEGHNSNGLLDSRQDMNDIKSNNENMFQQSQHNGLSNIRVDSPEGTGISVLLLQRSGSSKWPFVQGRALSATNILCSEPSYARDNVNAMKRSFGRDSTSASSSIDLGSTRQTEDHVQRQLSSEKYEVNKVAGNIDAKSQSTISQLEASSSTDDAAVTKSETEENFGGGFVEVVEYEAFRETVLITEENEEYLESGKFSLTRSSSIMQAVEGDTSICSDSCLAISTSDSHLPNHPGSVHLHDIFVAHTSDDEGCSSCLGAEGGLSRHSDRSIRDIVVPDDVPDSSVADEGYMLNDTCTDGKCEDATKNSSILKLEDRDNFQDIETECTPSDNPSNLEAFHERSASTGSMKGVSESALESNITGHAYEEPTAIPRGLMLRSLTLEEATDTILFCSSIIHDLAYKAANVGMEKELMMLEGSRPMVTVLGHSVPNQRGWRKISDKNMPKPQKSKRKRLEIHSKPTELDINVEVENSAPSNSAILNKPDEFKPFKPESKCNCIVM